MAKAPQPEGFFPEFDSEDDDLTFDFGGCVRIAAVLMACFAFMIFTVAVAVRWVIS